MNKSLNLNNSSLNGSPSPQKVKYNFTQLTWLVTKKIMTYSNLKNAIKKPKQMTLFEMGCKGWRFSLPNKTQLVKNAPTVNVPVEKEMECLIIE